MEARLQQRRLGPAHREHCSCQRCPAGLLRPHAMTTRQQTLCPGCGLELPENPQATGEGSFNATSECFAVFSEILGDEFGSPVLFGAVHQLSVDTYAVQHAGGPHPDKSIGVHLAGLYLALERGFAPTSAPPMMKRMADNIAVWPHFEPPPGAAEQRSMTVCDVALSQSIPEQIEAVKAWARAVWGAWSQHHEAVAALVAEHIDLDG